MSTKLSTSHGPGIKRTEIVAGKYKAAGSDARPLDSDSQAYLQSMVDHYYGMFLQAVARFRGVSLDSALSMADGKIFIGRQALDVGLVDEITTR